MTYTYKYSSCHDNAQQFGVYFEESIDLTVNNRITLTYPPATELREEYRIIDPGSKGTHKGGVVYLWRTSGTPGDLFGNITEVTKAGVITVSSGAGLPTTVTVGYYVAPQTYANPFPSWDDNAANSVRATKEIIQCLLNKCQFTSPLNLSRLGYRYAQVLCRRTFDNDPSVSAPWNSTSWAEVFNTSDDSYYDYLVPHDEYYPFVITEIRVYSDSNEIEVRPSIVKTGYDNNVIGEEGNDHINFASSSSTVLYDPGDSGNYLMSLPIGPVACVELKIEGKGNGSYPTNTPAIGDYIVLEVSGYYMPLSGLEAL